MTDEIKFRKRKKVELYLDDIHIGDPPTELGEHITLGFYAIIAILTFPIWVIPYLVSKIVVLSAKRKYKDVLHYRCPNCNHMIKEIGRLNRIECNTCGWYGYLDHIDKKAEIKRWNQN